MNIDISNAHCGPRILFLDRSWLRVVSISTTARRVGALAPSLRRRSKIDGGPTCRPVDEVAPVASVDRRPSVVPAATPAAGPFNETNRATTYGRRQRRFPTTRAVCARDVRLAVRHYRRSRLRVDLFQDLRAGEITRRI